MLGFALSGSIIKFFQMKAPLTMQFIYLAPDEILVTSLRIAMCFGIYLSFPFILYQLAKLKSDYIKTLSKKFILTILAGSFLLFTCGMLFTYHALMPTIIFFLLGFNSDVAVASFSISKYVSFCLHILFISGMIFEFPIFLALLANTNLISYKNLNSYWKQAIIGSFAISFLLSSSELYTLIFLAGVILFLYGVGVITTKIVQDNI
jgi:sec-independent protein translocase protein TatC